MRILIATPRVGDVATGNRCSAEQWCTVLAGLGHEVKLAGIEVPAPGAMGRVDLLVALNAARSHDLVRSYEEEVPEGIIVVVLTGTDIYPAPGQRALESMRRADFLVVLQDRALDQVPDELREKARVIIQAVPEVAVEPVQKRGGEDPFDVAVVAHLREVKDPLLAARAARLLDPGSRVRVQLAGAVLEAGFEGLVEAERAANPRFLWLGELDPEAARSLIADADLLVVSSKSEGAGRVVGEAVAVGTPVLSTRIDGVVGLLGDDYPGYFEVGDAEGLASLIARAERDRIFLDSLGAACRDRAAKFEPAAEREAWAALFGEVEALGATTCQDR